MQNRHIFFIGFHLAQIGSAFSVTDFSLFMQLHPEHILHMINISAFNPDLISGDLLWCYKKMMHLF